MDRFNYDLIKPEIRQSLDRWAQSGRPTGGFLRAMLCSDLFEACYRADGDNIGILPVIVAYVYNRLPMGCWGDEKKVGQWQGHRGLEGLEAWKKEQTALCGEEFASGPTYTATCELKLGHDGPHVGDGRFWP